MGVKSGKGTFCLLISRLGVRFPHGSPLTLVDSITWRPCADVRVSVYWPKCTKTIPFEVTVFQLRQVRVENQAVSQAAEAFGFSRPSFYQAHAVFAGRGLAGLIPQKRGPRHAHKHTRRAGVRQAGPSRRTVITERGTGGPSEEELWRGGPSSQPRAPTSAAAKKTALSDPPHRAPGAATTAPGTRVIP